MKSYQNHSSEIRGIILEGIPGSGKTTLLNTIQSGSSSDQNSFQSRLVLTDHHTQRVLEQENTLGTLELRQAAELLYGHIHYLQQRFEYLSNIDWCDDEMKFHHFIYFFERFHFSHVTDFECVHWQDVMEIDAQVAALGAQLVLLVLDYQDIRTRVIQERSTNVHWQNYIRRFGSTETEIINYYWKQQNRLQELAELTKIPVIQINTSHVDVQSSLIKITEKIGIVSYPE